MSGEVNRPAGAAGKNERHDLRLMTLLQRLVKERRLKGAAGTFGLDPRMVQSSLDRGELSELVWIALERHVLADGDERAAQSRRSRPTTWSGELTTWRRSSVAASTRSAGS